MYQKSLCAGALITLGVLTTSLGQQAQAASMTATLTADNHYALFTGNESGSLWNFIGRNEKGAGGTAQKDFVYNPDGSYNSTYIGAGVTSGDVASGGTYNWSMPETWTFDIQGGDYLYVVAWDDSSVTESWIGQFTSDALENPLLSQADSWEYFKSYTPTGSTYGLNPGDSGNTPGIEDLSFQVSTANEGINRQWINAEKKGDNGDQPWGDFSGKGISSEADFLATTNNTAIQGQRYTIFRTRFSVLPEEPPEVASTPEPASILGLFGLTLLPLSGKLRRRHLAQ